MKYNYKKIAKKVGIAGFVLAVMSVGMLFFAGAAQAAGNSGVYTSPVHDYGVSINFGNITWAASTTASTTITMKVRAGNTAARTAPGFHGPRPALLPMARLLLLTLYPLSTATAISNIKPSFLRWTTLTPRLCMM